MPLSTNKGNILKSEKYPDTLFYISYLASLLPSLECVSISSFDTGLCNKWKHIKVAYSIQY